MNCASERERERREQWRENQSSGEREREHIAVHGGADVDPNLPKECQEEAKQLLTRCLNIGISALQSSLSAIDVVELVAIDHIINSASKSNYMSTGRYLYPLFSEVQMVPLRVLVLNILRQLRLS